jgi:N-acyl-D-aspartate/D-glutamate deacylase
MDIQLDQYPYTAYQTGLQTIVLPRWANAADSEALAELINIPGNRERIQAEMSHHDWSRIKIATCATHPEYIGKSLDDLAANVGQPTGLCARFVIYARSLDFCCASCDVG